jgi:hypothetical protein
MSVVFAIGAAFAFAVASVTQQRAAARVEIGSENERTMMGRLLRDRLWIVGGAVDLIAFGLHAGALRSGQLSLVQPILTLGLVIALPLSARVGRRPHGRREWFAACSIAAAIAVFVLVARPSGGASHVGADRWLLTFVCCGVPAVGLVVVSTRVQRPAVRAAILAVATGLLYGLAAALTKSTVELVARGPAAVVTSWSPYALLAVGAIGLVIGQRAFQAAPLNASLPALTISDPVVGALIGLGLFGEHLALGGVRGPIVGLAIVTMVWGVVSLAGAEARAGTIETDPGPGLSPARRAVTALVGATEHH